MLRLAPGTEASTAEVVQVDYERAAHRRPPRRHARLRRRRGGGRGRSADTGDDLEARVIHGGVLKGRPGVHIPSDRLRITTPTPDDLRLLDAFIEVGVDMVALSFVRSAHDIRRVGIEPHPRGPLVVAKIETRAAVDNLDGIIEASGAVMVARGDLGSEFPIEELPAPAEARSSSQCIAARSSGHHRHPDARVDGPRSDAHPRRGLRRGQRGVRRLERGDALG